MASDAQSDCASWLAGALVLALVASEFSKQSHFNISSTWRQAIFFNSDAFSDFFSFFRHGT